MVLLMMKSYLLSIKVDSQPSLFLSGILKGVSVETPETPLDPPLRFSHDRFLDMIILCLAMKKQSFNILAIKYFRYFYGFLLIHWLIYNDIISSMNQANIVPNLVFLSKGKCFFVIA